MKLISVSWLSELKELNGHLFRYICKVFTAGKGIERHFADPDVLAVTNIARKVLHEQLRMKQFIRFQKAKDGTYLGVVSPDLDSSRKCQNVIRVTFEDEAAVPFNLANGKLDESVMSSDDQLLQDLWRTYFKAICIRERMNPRKQLNDMPRRYWKYMTEKN